MPPQDLTPELKVAVRVAAELFDRSTRVKQYLERLGPGETNEHQRLVETFQHALQKVEQEMINSFAGLWDIPPDEESRNQAVETLQDNLRIFSRSFTAIHELLAFLPRESIRPEAVFALEGCFTKFFKFHKPSVVLGSVVNAFEFNFIDILKERVPEISDIFPEDKPIFVLELAICDAESPLACAILAHELGHAIDVQYEVSSKVVEEFMNEFNIDSDFRPMLLNWSGELCADLVASRAAGPAPILSLISMEYCLFPEYVICIHSETHPSTRTRLQVVRQDMAESGASDLIGSEVEFYEIAWRLNLARVYPDAETRQEEEHFHDSAYNVFILPMAERVREKLSSLDLSLPSLRFDESSLKRCADRLRQGWPVSAQGEAPESLLGKVKTYKDKSFKSEEARHRAFKKLCDQFVETPIDVPRILLAGYRGRSEVMRKLEEAKQPLGNEDSVTWLCNSLGRLDRLIGSSIATTCVHREVLLRLKENSETTGEFAERVDAEEHS